MSSPEIDFANREPTTPVDDSSFVTAAYQAAEILHSPLVQPDGEHFEVLRVPFGRFGDGGTLDATLTWSDSALSGFLAYKPYDKNDRGRIHVERKAKDADWQWLNYTGRLSSQELADRLRADWPFGHDGFGEGGFAINDGELYAGLQRGLLAAAPYWQTELSYRHDQIAIDPAGELHHDSTTAFAIRTAKDGMKRLQMTATEVPATGGSDPVRCRVTVDELDMVEIRAFQHNSHANKLTEITIQDRERALGAMLLLLDRLIDEKINYA